MKKPRYYYAHCDGRLLRFTRAQWVKYLSAKSHVAVPEADQEAYEYDDDYVNPNDICAFDYGEDVGPVVQIFHIDAAEATRLLIDAK